MAKVDPFKDPLKGPVIIREDEGPTRGASHRGGGRHSKLFGFNDPEHGITVRASIATYTPERLNPRHKHVDEVVRFYYRGAESYGKDVLQEGDCVYIPEGVPYGPTRTAEGHQENRRIVFHFPGPSGLPTPAHAPYSATSSDIGATLLVVQLASQDLQSPPYCLI